jgi:hypothetical protein
MSKPRKPKFSLAPVAFREQSIAGRGVFAKRRFNPGDLIVPYAPKQRRLDVEDPEATLAAQSKLTLLSDVVRATGAAVSFVRLGARTCRAPALSALSRRSHEPPQ